MSKWSFITLAILIVAPLALSRHIEHNSAGGSSRRHEENREEEEDSWLFPKSHLRLHAKPPKVLHTKEGGSEILECQAGGSPLPHIYWLKNGEQLSKIDIEDELETKDDDEQRLNMGSTSSRLYLDCLTMGDEAEYTCIAENSNLRESTTTRVTVSSSDDRSCHDKKRFGQAPRIVTWTKTALENQGENVRVACRAEGVPKPKIKWLDPLEEEIDPERKSRFDILSNGDLVIRNLKWKDMGNYICIAENTHGSARAEVFVYPAALET
ncbi:neural/ectodermal development factor IMP-L2-like [Argiope bruennichi]|uniref:neural/ectodermal development factor IMP-L2-like n=1 Tax=Argiope bruennichi TaxID=94029 RepID=UPI0024941AC5|nr:neural/ectodermal development factor IMP-L2-like [Argiope bruennichi]XP_055948984.1 neural/ectodermal development factor IMP-L2-like [Argiope bruennichi]